MRRVVGVDVSRGLAILGMFTAHLADADPEFWSADGWFQVADGRPSAAFALLAGVSAALLSGGPAPAPTLAYARTRIAVRAVLIYVIGTVMVALGTPIAVILPAYALMFAMLLPALGLRPRTLVTVATAVVIVMPPVMLAVRGAWPPGEPGPPLWVELLFPRHYPPAVWIAYLLVGLAIGRLDLRSWRVRRRLAGYGLAAALVGHGVAAVGRRVTRPGSWWQTALDGEPHANTTPEVVGNTGVVLLVLVAALVIAERWPRLVEPLAATGALALTAYCGHLIAIAVLGPHVVRDPQPHVLVTFVVVTLVVTTVWRRLRERGPLELLLHRSSVSVADAVVGGETQTRARI